MNAEFKSPLVVLSLAVLAWGGMNLAGSLVEKRGKEKEAGRLAWLSREAELANAPAKKESHAVLVKPSSDAPIEIAAVEPVQSESSVVEPQPGLQPKVGGAEAPVP